jgi:cytochrome c-type biogenesis protein
VTGLETFVAAFVGGLLTSASPCALAAVPVAVGYVGGRTNSPRRAWVLATAFVAGTIVALTLLGLIAARLGLLMGTLPGLWSTAVGVFVIALGVWLWLGSPSVRGIQLPLGFQTRLAGSGILGAALLGALLGTVMTPCAAPALAAALALASTGTLLDGTTWQGAALLAVYGLGHSALLLVAGALPSSAQIILRRITPIERWLPGRRFFASVLVVAGLWWGA